MKAIGRAVGWEGEVIAVQENLLPEHLRSPASYKHDLAVGTRRIRKELGYEEGIPRDEALLKTIAWERANPPAEVDPKQFDYAAEDALMGMLKRTSAKGGG